MSLRHITAGLLVVLLLCGTAIAGACAPRCGLGVSAPTCGVAHEAMAMAPAHCCGMSMVGKDAATVVCPSVDCAHAAVSVAVVDDDGYATSGVPLAAVTRVPLPAPERPRLLGQVFERPPQPIAGSPQNVVPIRV